MEYLKTLVLIWGASAITILIFSKAKIPPIIGFIFTGAILSQTGLVEKDVVEVLSHIGVILLMFILGLEFSPDKILALRREVFLLGTLQVILAIFFTTIFSSLLGYPLYSSIFLGMIISLSSTAFVVEMLIRRGEIATSFGRKSIGILIFQDLIVILFTLFIPVMHKFSVGETVDFIAIIFALLKSIFLISLTFFLSLRIVPIFLYEVVKTKNRDLFIITIISLCFGFALFSSFLGLSFAIGAFLAGVIISQSEYSSQVISDIIPFKESFMGLFFVSLGMIFDFSALNPYIAFYFLIFLIIKILSAFIPVFFFSSSKKDAFLVPFYLSQVGEFSFVLAIFGKEYNLFVENTYQIMIGISIVSFILTPFLVEIGHRISNVVKFDGKSDLDVKEVGPLRDHIIVIGFGVIGRSLAKVLKDMGIPFVVLELNPQTVRIAQSEGIPIFYGDGTQIRNLEVLGLREAKIVAITIPDASSQRHIIRNIRMVSSPYIIARARFLKDAEELKKLGASVVISEEVSAAYDFAEEIKKFFIMHFE